MADAERQRLRAHAEADVDWEAVIEQAQSHRVLPLLGQCLQDIAPTGTPEAIQQQIRAARMRTAQFNMHRYGVLLDLIEAFDGADIPAIPFKGPVLANSYYGNLGARMFGDLDILVPRSDINTARACLRERGFEPVHSMSDDERGRFLDNRLAYEMVRSSDQVKVELHAALMHHIHSFHLSADAVRRRSQLFATGGHKVRVLAPEDLIIYLCAHGTKHWWKRLIWVCDVDRVVRRAEIDWSLAWQRATRCGSLRALKLGLYVAHDWLHTPLPESFRERVRRDTTVQSLADRLREEWLFHPADPEEAAVLTQLAYYLRTKERWRDRVPYLRHFATLAVQPTERDRDFLKLPDWLEGLYYAVRPVRIALDYLRSGREERSR